MSIYGSKHVEEYNIIWIYNNFVRQVGNYSIVKAVAIE